MVSSRVVRGGNGNENGNDGDAARAGGLRRKSQRAGIATARVGGVVLLSAIALVLNFASAQIFAELLIRFIYATLIVQILLVVTAGSVKFPVYMVLLAITFGSICYATPVSGSTDPQVVLTGFGIILAPIGLVTAGRGVVSAELERVTKRSYWALESESLSGNPVDVDDSRKRRGTSLIAMLLFTKKVVRTLEVVGLDTYDKRMLLTARNRFLYRLRHSSSRQVKALAVDRFFQEVCAIAFQRTASQIARPSSRDSRALNSMQDEMTYRILRQVEVVIMPLPRTLEPTSLVKFLFLCGLAVLTHRRGFKLVKELQGGELNAGMETSKHVTRFGILIYLTGRYLINSIKKPGGRGTMLSGSKYS